MADKNDVDVRRCVSLALAFVDSGVSALARHFWPRRAAAHTPFAVVGTAAQLGHTQRIGRLRKA